MAFAGFLIVAGRKGDVQRPQPSVSPQLTDNLPVQTAGEIHPIKSDRSALDDCDVEG